MSTVIGIDIGGTSARIGAFTSSESDTITDRRDFKITGQYANDLKQLVSAIRELAGDDLGGVGLGVAGKHAPDQSRLLSSTHLRDWVGKPIKDELAETLSCPVALINDAEAAAGGEAVFGGHEEDFWVVNWGTGVGGSIVEQHANGPRVVAAEPGHHVIRWDKSSPRCKCGRYGDFEAYVGGAYFESRFGKTATELSEDDWNDITDWFARGLHNVVITRPVSEVVLGGGVTLKQAHRIPEIERKTNELLHDVQTLRVTAAAHGEDAGMVGAMAALRT